jgi:transcriptional regulator with XRE-family HTH domain
MSKRAAELVTKAMDESARTTEVMKRDLVLNAEQAQIEKEEAIANIYEMAGKIKTTGFNKAQSEFFELLMLKQVKDSKEYREKFGMTWEQFCEHVGVNRRTVDNLLIDLKPFKVEFLAKFANFAGFPINKIKYLEEPLLANIAKIEGNVIVYNGETIPFEKEYKEDFQTLLETLEENHKKEKDEADTTIRTKNRLLKAKDDTLNKLERELKRLEKTVEKSELTEEEQDAVNLLAQVQVDFLTSLSDIKKKIKPHEAPEIALRQYYYLLIFISKLAMEERLNLQTHYEGAEEVPWEITEMEIPSQDVLIDNLPATAGKGMGAKVKAKLEERAAKKVKK